MRHFGLQELTRMNILKFSQTVEQNIQEELIEAYPGEWDEDYITLRICRALRRLDYTQLEVLNTYSNVYISAYKLKGVNERKFGDIAILVDLEFKDADKIKGAGFLEAKMRYDNSNEYTALDFDQLERIYGNAPSAKVILYNYEHMSILAPTGFDTSRISIGNGVLPKMPVTFTSVVPINTVLHLNAKNTRLHKVSIPFSYQFAYRYLYGMDLEFDTEKVNAAKGYIEEKYGRPTYIVAVIVRPGKREEKETSPSIPDINLENYYEITNKDNLRKS
jgi:hypothetical protein